MFEINWRVPIESEDLECMSSEDIESAYVEGFFEMKFNERTLGYVLEGDFLGNELITFWFSLLLESVSELERSRYVAFRVPESHNTWIELSLTNGLVYVNLRRHEPQMGFSPFIVLTPFGDFSSTPDDSNPATTLDELKHILRTEVNKYVATLVSANDAFKDSRALNDLSSLASKL